MSVASVHRSPVRISIDDSIKVPLAEIDVSDWCRQIQDVQDAIMDEIEETFRSASPCERQSLINAMNAVHELQRIANRIRAKA
jgi:hypothetical protein